jgi:serine/threonine protein phosphatase PrpC
MQPGLTFIDAVNVPSGSGTGDDRYGFDEGAGTAWVVDGATDVGTARLFPEYLAEPDAPILGWESDAAWYADRLSERFTRPPEPQDSARTYLERVITDIATRAQAEAVRPIENEPRHNLPSAGGIWLRRIEDTLEFAALGDCIAIVRTGGQNQFVGQLDLIKAEHALNRKQLAEPAGKAGGYASARETRNRMNTEGAHWVFSLHPEAASRADVTQIRMRGETQILLMSDGFFRLVEPYGLYDIDTLMTRAIEDDALPALTAQLRAAEKNPEDDARIGRLKTSDDACAVLVEIS